MSTLFSDPTTNTAIPGAVSQMKDTQPTATPISSPENDPTKAASQIATWVMTRVGRWRQLRDSEYLARWNEYYRLWRGVWDQSDKTRNSERSRIITPALAEAVDLTHAEITEAVFGRDRWFDVTADLADPDRESAEKNRDQLQEDMEKRGVQDSIIKAIQMGCLYGTGAVKVSTEVVKERTYKKDPQTGKMNMAEAEVAEVSVYPIDPRELVPDPGAACIKDMLGIAHETYVPQHTVHAKQADGTYLANQIMGKTQSGPSRLPKGVLQMQTPAEDVIFVTEYHGLVPTALLMSYENVPVPDTLPKDDLSEAIITIGNESVALRVMRNPFWMQDRAILAYQHESVPGEFWGRGVSEKGFNPQKALDAEVRMRIDALGLVASPMIAADRSRLPRGFDMRVYPGKAWPTVGNPSEVVQPFNFGSLNAATFDQSSHLEQMVKQATGAMDPGTALSQGSRRDTASGTAMMSAGMVKRAKRTMYNIENQFLEPLIQMVLWRYLQFAPEKYSIDTSFTAKGAMGIMAREYEQGVLMSLYQTTDAQDPTRKLILREIFNLSGSPHKQEMVDMIDNSMKPDPKQQQKQQMIEQLQLRKAMLEVEELSSKVQLNQTGANKNQATAQSLLHNSQLKEDELLHDAMRVNLEASQMDVLRGQAALSAQGNILKAKGLDIQQQKLELEKRKVTSGKPTA